MADTRDEIQAALDEARKAREDADRVRREAKAEAERLKEEARRARDEARRLREEARRQARSERRSPPPPPGFAGPRLGLHFEGRADPGGVRSEQSFSMDGVTAIHLNQTAGKLTVRACQDGETPGISAIGNKTTPEIAIVRDGDRLNIEVKLTRGWLFRRRQGATTLVRLENRPLDQLRIDNGYGETEVQGLSASDLRIHVGAGSVQCISTRGSLDVNVGAGKLSVLSHAGLANCDSGTGDVLLDVAEIAEGEYKVDVGIGRAEVRLPEGSAVYIKAASGIGKSRIEHPGAPEGAPTRLRINSGIGECIVRTRDGRAGAAPAAAAPAGQSRPQRPGRAAAASRRREAEEMRVLQMLEQGKISPQDAADLIAALQGSTSPQFEEDEEGDPPVFH